MRGLIVVALFALTSWNSAWCWPRRARSESFHTSFVGQATNDLANAILQGYVDDEKNLAFSPLGYSAILAILAEGAVGETRQQLQTALHLPTDQKLTRETYKFIMQRLKNTNKYDFNRPELKNWFYIYKNYTINEDYQKILEDFYLTDVRTVEKYGGYTPQESLKPSENIEEPVDVNEPLTSVEIKDTIPTDIADMKDVKTIQNEEERKELLLAEETEEKLITFAVEDKPDKTEFTVDEYIKPAKNIKEKIKLVKTYPKNGDSLDDEEEMLAVEARNHGRSLRLLDKDDVSSSISVNSVGKKMKNHASNSLMIMFNGMYFRGSWKTPFQSTGVETFYRSATVKKQVLMMRTIGTFRTGSLPGLDSEAIELPYEGGRYALVVVIPRARDGLSRLVADLPGTPLAQLHETLQPRQLSVALPPFYIETTTKPVAALAKFGVSSIFSPEANLSRISSVEGLFVQELVQHVSVKVDNGASAVGQVTVNDIVTGLKRIPSEEEKNMEKFTVEHPFLFFIHDVLDNLVVVAGKVTNPDGPETILE